MTDTEFLALIQQHQRVIRSLCWIHRKDAEDQRDLYQDILYELFKCRHAFQRRSNVSTWIYSVAFNTATDIYYSKKAEVIRLTEIKEVADNSNEWAERRGELVEAMRFLDNEERSLLILYMEQLSYDEISQITEMSMSLVGVRIHRIKTKIRNILKDTNGK